VRASSVGAQDPGYERDEENAAEESAAEKDAAEVAVSVRRIRVAQSLTRLIVRLRGSRGGRVSKSR